MATNYYQEHKELRERYQNLTEEEKEKRRNKNLYEIKRRN